MVSFSIYLEYSPVLYKTIKLKLLIKNIQSLHGIDLDGI
jgi:hypothetical protein